VSVAVVWAPEPQRASWIAAELRAANIEPLRAASFRHVETSLRAALQPACKLAVIDVVATSDEQLNALISARWAGFRGKIIAIGEIAPRWITLVNLTPAVFGAPLRDLVR
jgi:hypothetical protein